MNTNNKRLRKTAVIAGMISIVGAALVGNTAALAAPSFGNINPDASGSIIVHKHEEVGNTVESPADGSAPPTSSTLAGVTFRAYQILGLDLTTNDGWSEIQNISPIGCDLPEPYVKGPEIASTPVVTGQDGIATFGGLSVAGYLICETEAPNDVIEKAAPFIVSVPHPFQGGWIYDVNAYPKNSLSAVVKQVLSPAGLGLGADVQFPVSVAVPHVQAGNSLTSFVVSDTLDMRLTPKRNVKVKIGNEDVPEQYYEVGGTGQTVEVVFNSEGLTWLSGHGGGEVISTFVGTVNAVGDGKIENAAVAFLNDPLRENGIASNAVQTLWGDLLVLKTDQNTGSALHGAQFEVYEGSPATGDCSASLPSGEAISINEKSVFETGADGRLTIDGLFVSDSNSPGVIERCYVLKEIKAPVGYVTPNGSSALFPVQVAVGESAAIDITVKNSQQTVPQLPLTGGAGTVWLTIAGLGLAGFGVALVMARRRNHRRKVAS